jgi:hypothetical protein
MNKLSPAEVKDIVARVYSGEYEYEKLREAKPYGMNLLPWNELTKECQERVKLAQETYTTSIVLDDMENL